MLSLKFSGAIFISVLLLLITFPAISFNPAKKSGLTREFLDSASVPKTPLNKQATQFVKKYIKDNDECLDAVKQNGVSAFALIDSILSKHDLPVQLKYLAVVESELKTKAISRVGAVGPWQLMPGTAKVLGLKVTRKYDERKNLKKSTRAAAIYLRDLYAQYQDWLLVLAAYNCGPGPVNSAIRRSGSRNFWKLQYLLPAEIRQHVKKYIATHYYFEGEGGVTTLTKMESIKFTEELAVWSAKQEKENPATQSTVADNIILADTSRKIVALK